MGEQKSKASEQLPVSSAQLLAYCVLITVHRSLIPFTDNEEAEAWDSACRLDIMPRLLRFTCQKREAGNKKGQCATTRLLR
jgi:hypothetical protein